MSRNFITEGYEVKFGQPEVSLGITPGFGRTQRMIKSFSRNRARQISNNCKITIGYSKSAIN